ncbi:TetR/AcrR family transcriptional regulator [Nocardia sp. NPDC004860]|uniref:TetR/AcrR family transcriptional regulator n=1 Tax=Nocardia sp. NPDC004860 TaxID=3154557 RepID=UPI0033B55FB2
MTKPETSSKADDKRRRLINAGLGLMEDLPYAEITVAMVAERARMARGLVFYYFKDKEALFHGVVRDLLNGVRQSFEENDVLDAQDDPRAWLRRELEVFLDFMAAHPQAMETIVSQGWQDEQDEAGTTMMDFTASRMLLAFGGSPGDELLDAALHSWAHHCVDFAIRLRKTAPRSDRSMVVAILVNQAEAVFTTLETAAD